MGSAAAWEEPTLIEWRVDRTTTEKLAQVLNELVDMGRMATQTTWTGGRDWVVISTRHVTKEPAHA